MRMNASPKMTVMRSKIFLILTVLILAASLRAQTPEYIHQVVRSFRVTNGVTLDLANKYGKVHVIKWNNDSVKFIIDLRIRTKDASKMQKLKQNIDFEFTASQYFLNARTKIGDNASDVFQDIKDIAGTYLSSSNTVTINYTVMVPDYISLRIDNKFGNVYLDDADQNFNLTLSYGDFSCNRLTGKSEIRITSGNAEIGYIREGLLFLSYGNLHLHDAGKLTAETRSSTVTIDKSAELRINSRRDKFYLNELGSFSGESYFSNINGGILHNEMNFISRYGAINLDNIRKTFTSLNLSAEFTKVTLAFEKSASYNLELSHHQEVVFVYPKSMASLKTRVTNVEEKQFLTTGVIGTEPAVSNVVLNVPKKCNLTLISK
jgi:hypothetical protein